MSALREVFARFTTSFDDREVTRGDSSVSGLTERLRGLGTVIAGSALVLGVRSFANSMASIGDELDKTSRNIGISTSDMQGWRFATGIAGMESSAFSTSLVRLQRQMLEATRNGSGPAAQAFQRLGVDVRDGNGQLREAGDVLQDMANPMNALGSDAERVALSVQLMGRSGAQMGTLFQEGSEGIAALRAEVEELGGGMSQEAIQAAADYTDASTRLDVAILGIKSRLSVQLLPALQRGIEVMTRVSVAVQRLVDRGRLLEVVFVAIGIAAMIAGRNAMIAWISTLAPILAVAAVAAGAILVFEDLVIAIEGGDSVIGRLAESVRELAAEHVGTGGAMGIIVTAWEWLNGAINSTLDAIMAVGRALGMDIPELPDRVDINRDARSEEERLIAQAFMARNDDALGQVIGAVTPDDFERRVALNRSREFLEERRASGGSISQEDIRQISGGNLQFSQGALDRVNQVNNVVVNAETNADPAQIAQEVERVMDRQNREAVEALGQ